MHGGRWDGAKGSAEEAHTKGEAPSGAYEWTDLSWCIVYIFTRSFDRESFVDAGWDGERDTGEGRGSSAVEARNCSWDYIQFVLSVLA